MACLDTDALLDLQGRGGRRLLEAASAVVRGLILRGEPLVTTRLNATELMTGVFASKDPDVERRRVNEVLSRLQVLEFDDSAAERFGQITAALRKLGRPAGDLDVLIAATAQSRGHAVVTRNRRHFADIKELEVISYA